MSRRNPPRPLFVFPPLSFSLKYSAKILLSVCNDLSLYLFCDTQKARVCAVLIFCQRVEFGFEINVFLMSARAPRWK
jgi:hypothetical protein